MWLQTVGVLKVYYYQGSQSQEGISVAALGIRILCTNHLTVPRRLFLSYLLNQLHCKQIARCVVLTTQVVSGSLAKSVLTLLAE